MRIEEIQIKGYRSLFDVAWKPGNLNVLIGPNASGKTNLLKFFELVAASSKGQLSDHIQREGGFDLLTWDNSANELIIIINSIHNTKNSETNTYYTYELNIAGLGGTSSFQISREILGNYSFLEEYPDAKPVVFFERKPMEVQIFDVVHQSLENLEGLIFAHETILSLFGNPLTSTAAIHKSEIIDDHKKFFSGWAVYRLFSTDQNAQIRMPAVSRFEKQVSSDGQNLISVLHTLYTTDREFKKELNGAMRAAFGDDFDEIVFPPDADQRVQLRIRWKSLKKERSAADLSDGTLRFLLLMAVLANPNPAPLIAIDEPEIGLHPSMLPIVAEFAVEASRKSQVIFATHSPEVLGAFTDTIPTTTVVKNKKGKTELKIIEGKELAKWLKEYSLGELMRTGELENMG